MSDLKLLNGDRVTNAAVLLVGKESADLDKIVGSHVSEKQLRNFLDQLKKDGKLKTKGSTNQTHYMLANETTN